MNLPSSLLQSYLTTDYRVALPGGKWLSLWIGERSRTLTALMARTRARHAAYLTAWHPRSRVQPRKMNEAAQRRLRSELLGRGYKVFSGVGVGADRKWQEPSLLVLGIDRAEAKRFGRRYRQNALLIISQRGTPELVLLSPPRSLSNDRTHRVVGEAER